MLQLRLFLNRYCTLYPYISGVLFLHRNLFGSIRNASIVSLRAASKELAYISLLGEVHTVDYDTHFSYSFSATTNEPTDVVLVIPEPPFLRKRTNTRLSLKSSGRRWRDSVRVASKLGSRLQGNIEWQIISQMGC